MYLRPAFVETDPVRIRALIIANPFGLLVTHGPEGLDASHVPFVIEEEGQDWWLAGHLAAANAQCAHIEGSPALAAFGGPHAYVSPGWYRTQPAVPTWDFAAVHVHGRLEPVTDAASIAAGLRALGAHDAADFSLDALPEGFRAKMIAGIRAFRLRPERVEAQWKMSQNRSRRPRGRHRGVAGARRGRGRGHGGSDAGARDVMPGAVRMECSPNQHPRVSSTVWKGPALHSSLPQAARLAIEPADAGGEAV